MSQDQLSIAWFPQLSVEFSIFGNSKTVSFCFSCNTYYIPLHYLCVSVSLSQIFNAPSQEIPFSLLVDSPRIPVTYSLIQQQVLNVGTG